MIGGLSTAGSLDSSLLPATRAANAATKIMHAWLIGPGPKMLARCDQLRFFSAPPFFLLRRPACDVPDNPSLPEGDNAINILSMWAVATGSEPHAW